MSVQAMSWVLDEEKTTMGGDRLVLLSIANHADKYGDNSWPSIATIAQEANISERSVQYSLSKLVAAKIVAVEKQAGGKWGMRTDRRPNRYTIVPMQPRGEAQFTPQEKSRGEAHFTPQNPRGELSTGTGCNLKHHGVQSDASRGEAHFTRTIREPSENRPKENAPEKGAAGSSKKKRSNLDPLIKAVTDKLYWPDPGRFRHLITWVRKQERDGYEAVDIAAALGELHDRESKLGPVENWWGYLDGEGKNEQSVIERLRTTRMQAESAKHKTTDSTHSLKEIFAKAGFRG